MDASSFHKMNEDINNLLNSAEQTTENKWFNFFLKSAENKKIAFLKDVQTLSQQASHASPSDLPDYTRQIKEKIQNYEPDCHDPSVESFCQDYLSVLDNKPIEKMKNS